MFRILLLLVGCAISSVAAQNTVQTTCDFQTTAGDYTCLLSEFVLTAGDTLIINANQEGALTNADVTQVMIYAANVSFVPNQVFSTFPNLEALYMNSVQLETINEDSFNDAVNLRIFSGYFNSIRSIGATLCRDLNNIFELDFGFNSISEVHANAFVGCERLEVLDLNENSLTSASLVGRFAPLTNLRSLYLSGNTMGSLPANFFPLPELRLLFLYNNQITSIHSDAFLQLPRLEILFIFMNDVTSLSGNLFRDLHALQILDISLMGLLIIQPVDFTGLDHLRSIYISENRIQALTPTMFNHMVSEKKKQTDRESFTQTGLFRFFWRTWSWTAMRFVY